MDRRRHNIRIFLLLHQLMIRTILMVCLLTRHRTKVLTERRRQQRRTSASYNMSGRMNAQMNHLRRIIETGDVQCVVNLRMNRNTFAQLCYLLTHVGGLHHSRYVRIEEKVVMFLSILAHHKKNRVIGHDYIRSGQTISTHFHEVLGSVLKLYSILLVKPSPVDETCTDETWKWFKGCVGALDGTYINVNVLILEKGKYRTRKRTIAVNVLGVCNRDMNFIYALCGWEGSAADARVLRDALSRHDGLKVERGCYYLCDNGYANVKGFLNMKVKKSKN
ncbi:uncharacterized protein [Primulina huaijiensis]|uniref:uncharacterized protein n=1 Tax=Primulina huaijiensis TaxID=1492673 RepID=UPI003CC76A78